MKLKLIIPELKDYWYEQKLQSDPNTMDYNAGYDVSYEGYHYDTGCIDFPEEKWEATYNRRIAENRYFAYIKDLTTNEYVGYVNYHNCSDGTTGCGLVIESIHRGKGYAKPALELLIKEADRKSVV